MRKPNPAPNSQISGIRHLGHSHFGLIEVVWRVASRASIEF
jgi:hypothetical protein